MNRNCELVSYLDDSVCDCSFLSCPSVAPCLMANSGVFYSFHYWKALCFERSHHGSRFPFSNYLD